MATKLWIGNAQPRPDVWWYTPASVDSNSKFTLTINGKDITAKAGEQDASGTATDITAAGIVQLFSEKIAATDIAEWNEVAATMGFLDTGGTSITPATEDGTTLVLTGPSDGKPVTITGSTSTSSVPEVLIIEVMKGVAGVNEKQSVSFGTAATGGTFTLTYAGQTTAAIAYNANAATFELAFEALSSVGAGNGTTTGSAGAWVVEFTGALAATNVPLITGNGTNLTGAGSVTISTTTQGGGSLTNEIQDFFLPTAGAGPYRMLLYNASATACYTGGFYPASSVSEVQGLVNSALGAGNAVVSSATAASGYVGFRVEFTGSCGGVNIATGGVQVYYVYDGTWGATSDALVDTATVVQEGGGAAVNEVQRIVVYTATGGNFTLTFQGQTTGAITYSATAATLATNIQTALEALSNIGVGEATVAASTATAVSQAFTVTFSGALAGMDLEQMTANAAGLTGGSVLVTTTTAAVAAVNEVQSISLPNNPSAGTFTISFGGYTTTAIAYDASAATLDTALEALTSIGAGQVAVTGTAPNWTATFGGTLAATDVALMTGSGYGLTIAGTQTQQIRRATTRKYTGGTWVQATRVFTPGNAVVPTSEGIAVGDRAQVFLDSTIGGAAYMAAVSARDATTITLSADAIEGTPPADGTTDHTLLIVTAPTGPNYWDDVDNWSTGVLPVDADTIVFESTAIDCLYGLVQTLITPAIVRIKTNYSGKIGLAREDDYYEYRPAYLTLGNTADAQTITIEIGQGNGDGSGRIKLNTGTAQTALYVFGTGTPAETDVPAVLWKGTHASNVADVQRGSMGVAFYADESATVATLTMGWIDDQARDASVFIGTGTTLTTVNKTGGTLDLWVGFTTLTQVEGLTEFRDGTAGTITQYAGRLNYASDGGYTAINQYGGTVDFSSGEASITGTNTTIYDLEEFKDESKRTTFTNAIAYKPADLGKLKLGANIGVQRS